MTRRKLLAFHEAGHFVVGAALGYRPTHATIDGPDDDPRGFCGFTRGRRHGLDGIADDVALDLSGRLGEMLAAGENVRDLDDRILSAMLGLEEQHYLEDPGASTATRSTADGRSSVRRPRSSSPAAATIPAAAGSTASCRTPPHAQSRSSSRTGLRSSGSQASSSGRARTPQPDAHASPPKGAPLANDNVTVRVEGLNELKAKLKVADEETKAAVKGEMKQVGTLVARKAQELAEAQGLHRSGKLIAAIRPGVLQGMVAVVRDSAKKNGFNYPAVYEGKLSGHGLHGRGPRPFLAPAVEAETTEILAGFERVLERVAASF